MVRLAEHTIVLDAPAAVVYEHLTTAEGLLRWIAVDAIAEPIAGGRLQWTHANGDTMVGRFVELDPPRRLVIAYGWRGDLMGVPPESTTVEIVLDEHDGRTTLRLVHRGIPPDVVDKHQYGWIHFLTQLQASIADARPTHTPGRS
jgi:uncharacterized protein YndB with AHSA1/START domain